MDHNNPRPSQTAPRSREFTFPAFERLTPDLTGAGRLAVFFGLPADLQSAAWAELDARVEQQSRERFAEERLGGWATPQEIADEVALIWREEIKPVPLGTTEPMSPNGDTMTPRAVPRTQARDGSVLLEISPTDYVPALTGQEIGRDGKVCCPFHGDGDERTPSLQVWDDPKRGWCCHSCGLGGTIVDFGAALYGIQPRGRGFHDILRRLAADLLGVS